MAEENEKPAEENEKLREARERTPSPANSDECLSRQELAEMVNTWIWNHRNKKVVEASANYIGKLERGVVRWPGRLYREAFRAIFNVPNDSALGFINPRRAVVKLADVKRRKFFKTIEYGGISALVLEGPVTAFLESLLEGSNEPAPIPRRVGAADIEQIRTATRVFESWSAKYGGELTREAVMGQLRWSVRLLVEAKCPDRLLPELRSAVGYLAKTAGYVAVDANAHEEARRVYHFAWACAEEAKDWPLRAEALSCMAVQAIWTGQPDDGLTLAEHALVRADRLTPTGRAVLHVDRGRALAKMHRVNEALSAIGTADEHFAHFNPDNEPPVMAFYNAERHAFLTGQSLFDLAILGRDPGEATDRFAAAVAAFTGTDDTRSRAICLTKLASLAMATGDPLQAAAIGHAALDIADTIRSRRAAEELRELARYAAPHQHLDEVAHLRHRIAMRNFP